MDELSIEVKNVHLSYINPLKKKILKIKRY